MKRLLVSTLILAMMAVCSQAQESGQIIWEFAPTNSGPMNKMVKYWHDNVSTNHPVAAYDYGFKIVGESGIERVRVYWQVTNTPPTQATIDAQDEAAGFAIREALRKTASVDTTVTSEGIDKAFFEALFIILNDVRVLKGQGTVTKKQFREWLKDQM